jgi:dihydropteroate synthase
MTQPIWQTSRFAIDLTQPKVMGIVNLTPDSFSDGGRHSSLSIALENAQTLLAQGADILDIGGESSRPGAEPVSVEEELKRVLPFLQEALTWNVPISVDTYKPEVMQAALDLGADVVNDIWALRQPGALQVVARHPQCGVCLMHMHQEPLTMLAQPMTGDALPLVKDFLTQQVLKLRHSGVQANRIVLDPGIGFGKTLEQNLSLLQRQSELVVSWSSADGRLVSQRHVGQADRSFKGRHLSPRTEWAPVWLRPSLPFKTGLQWFECTM